MLFNEPKLLKCDNNYEVVTFNGCFSALQRAEIAEISTGSRLPTVIVAVSVLFNEPKLLKWRWREVILQRVRVSVLFNEPKLLKRRAGRDRAARRRRFSALQRAEIAEIGSHLPEPDWYRLFQCSSTSRNC